MTAHDDARASEADGARASSEQLDATGGAAEPPPAFAAEHGAAEPGALSAGISDLSTATAEIERLRRALMDARADVSLQRARAEAAESRLALKRSALQIAPVAVLIASVPAADVFSINPAAEELLDLKAEDGPFAPEEALPLLADDGAPLPPPLHPLRRVIFAGEEELQEDLRLARPDGRPRWVRIFAEGVRDSEGALRGAALAIFDVEDERRAAAQQELVVRELNHRVKNVFAAISALAAQSLRGSPEMDQAREQLRDRIRAYAESHAMLVQADWIDGPVEHVVRLTLRALIDQERVIVGGEPVIVDARVALSLALALHELATNATKYGALSVEGGHVSLRWERREGGGWRMTWAETGGPPPNPGKRQGFGAFVTRDAVELESGGTVTLDWPESGLIWTLTV